MTLLCYLPNLIKMIRGIFPQPQQDNINQSASILSELFQNTEEKWIHNTDKMFREKSPNIIHNGKSEHAVRLMVHIFKDADREICISTGNLPDKVCIDDYGFILPNNIDRVTDDIFADKRIINAALSFLALPQNRLRIFVHDPNFLVTNSKFLSAIKTHTKDYQNKVFIFRKKTANHLTIPTDHFMINDNDAYRLEKGVHNDNSLNAIAKAYAPRENDILTKSFCRLATPTFADQQYL